MDIVQKWDRVGKVASKVYPPFPGNKNRFFVEPKALMALKHPSLRECFVRGPSHARIEKLVLGIGLGCNLSTLKPLFNKSSCC
jgi:hypothetical protein